MKKIRVTRVKGSGKDRYISSRTQEDQLFLKQPSMLRSLSLPSILAAGNPNTSRCLASRLCYFISLTLVILYEIFPERIYSIQTNK